MTQAGSAIKLMITTDLKHGRQGGQASSRAVVERVRDVVVSVSRPIDVLVIAAPIVDVGGGVAG